MQCYWGIGHLENVLVGYAERVYPYYVTFNRMVQ